MISIGFVCDNSFHLVSPIIPLYTRRYEPSPFTHDTRAVPHFLYLYDRVLPFHLDYAPYLLLSTARATRSRKLTFVFFFGWLFRWLIAMVVIQCVAMSMAELASSMPNTFPPISFLFSFIIPPPFLVLYAYDSELTVPLSDHARTAASSGLYCAAWLHRLVGGKSCSSSSLLFRSFRSLLSFSSQLEISVPERSLWGLRTSAWA